MNKYETVGPLLK